MGQTELKLGPTFQKQHELGRGIFYGVHELGPGIFFGVHELGPVYFIQRLMKIIN